MKILFLDDMESRRDKFQTHSIGHTVDFAINAHNCEHLLNKNPGDYDLIYLDHDLEPEHYNMTEGSPDDQNGQYIAKLLVKLSKYHGKTVVIHTLNPLGREKMHEILKDKFKVLIMPHAWNVPPDILLAHCS